MNGVRTQPGWRVGHLADARCGIEYRMFSKPTAYTYAQPCAHRRPLLRRLLQLPRSLPATALRIVRILVPKLPPILPLPYAARKHAARIESSTQRHQSFDPYACSHLTTYLWLMGPASRGPVAYPLDAGCTAPPGAAGIAHSLASLDHLTRDRVLPNRVSRASRSSGGG